MKKIIRIISRLNIGGPAIHTILLTSELDRMGYKTILVKGKESEGEGDMLDFADKRGVTPILIDELGREISFRKDIIALLNIYTLIRREKPDIIHTHTAKAGALGRLAAFLYTLELRFKKLFKSNYAGNPPPPIIIHTFHGHVLSGYFRRFKSLIFIYTEKVLALLSTKVITLSDRLKKELIDMNIGNSRKIEVIPLGLELEGFFSASSKSSGYKGKFKDSLGISMEAPLVGIIGRLVPIKGHRYFIESAKMVLSSKGQGARDVKFVIIGDGELRKELEDYTRELGIGDSVIFTGFRSDLHEIYSDLDIVVLSSLNEGTPVSVIEAMAAGKPVIATEVGGVPDLIKNNRTGIIIPPCDSRAIADAIVRLLKDKELREFLGNNAQREVYPKYSVDNLVANINSLYTSLLNDRKVAI
ncbi:MAG: glycosyltransferase family 4 protein [Nitrospirota bacterium]